MRAHSRGGEGVVIRCTLPLDPPCDMLKCSNNLEFQFFADDTNLFLNNPNILNLKTNLNVELEKVSQWLYANKLSHGKPSFLVFHSPQRRIAHKLNLSISNMSVKSDNQVKYLGLIFDSNLNWKPYLHELSKKVSIGIGALSKIRYYVNGNTVHIIILFNYLPLPHLWFINLGQYLYLQKRAKRTITFFKTR